MQIVAALFIEEIDVRQVPGPSTRLDLTGAHFSVAAPDALPLVWTPHLVVIVRCPADGDGNEVLEVVYTRDGEQIARNVQYLQVEPGKFSFRLVRAELQFEDYSTVEAHCRLGSGPTVVVPYTMLPPAADA
ncbi:MAG: hypothetical protein OXH20_08810 [bacterium]|nr:hypothetical protein [bacterium]MXZ29350.1 hypothetical protein [Acidimicrobiia bacterium]MYB25283.1 hypothetical protein [Acidimicrobiia bacterium]MYE67342.1 hypothetical protein [Acidimicrobiia bacterium]MYJ14074.1 hypothetical protein [Acidimicrobiia bacterium]